MDGGAWWATVHGVAMSPSRLSNFTFTFHFHAMEKEMATHSSVLAWRIPGTAEAWWAAVYGVAQSRTRLKRLSSSSSSRKSLFKYRGDYQILLLHFDACVSLFFLREGNQEVVIYHKRRRHKSWTQKMNRWKETWFGWLWWKASGNSLSLEGVSLRVWLAWQISGGLVSREISFVSKLCFFYRVEVNAKTTTKGKKAQV